MADEQLGITLFNLLCVECSSWWCGIGVVCTIQTMLVQMNNKFKTSSVLSNTL